MKKILFSLLMIILLISFTGCVEANIDGAKNKMVKNDFSVSIDETIVPALIKVKCGVNCKLLYAFNDDGDYVYAFYFDSKTDSQKSYEYITEWAKNNSNNDNTIIKDKAIYFGSEKGVIVFE